MNATIFSHPFRFGRHVVAGLSVLACVACTPRQNIEPQAEISAAQQVQDAKDLRDAKLLKEAFILIKAHKPAEAIDGPLAAIIGKFEGTFGKSDKTYYCARGTTESLLYMFMAANADKGAVVIGPIWADAYRMKGYALIDLGRVEDAQAELKKALDLSPENAYYLSELAYTHQLQHHLATALDIYTHAEEAARAFSPENVKTAELSRALRGQGFVLSDMNRLDEAESRYRAALKLDPGDEKARHELEYIAALRKR